VPCQANDGIGGFGGKFGLRFRFRGHVVAVVVSLVGVLGVVGGRRLNNRRHPASNVPSVCAM
jgi:hypothetical protein